MSNFLGIKIWKNPLIMSISLKMIYTGSTQKCQILLKLIILCIAVLELTKFPKYIPSLSQSLHESIILILIYQTHKLSIK